MKECYLINDDEAFKEIQEYILEENVTYKVNGNKLITPNFDVEFEQAYTHFLGTLHSPSEYEDALIFGKDQTEEIVAAEVVDNELWLFKQNGDVEVRPNVFWLLSRSKLTVKSRRLEGNQNYRYITTFKDKKQYNKQRNLWRNKDIFCIWDDVEAAMVYYGITMFKGLKIEDLSVLSYDIEADSIYESSESKVFMISNTLTQNGEVISRKVFREDEFENDGKMIQKWCEYVQEMNPDILNGHNVFGYDLRYMRHVASLYDQKLPLGRNCNNAKFGTKPRNYRVDGSNSWEYLDCRIFGRQIIDGIFLAVKYDIGRNYPSWGLKPIAEYEGIVKEDRQFYDASQIGKNWHIPEEREKIVAYGRDDSDDSNALFYLHAPSLFYMAQSISMPFQMIVNKASGGWLNNIMVRSYLQLGQSIAKTSEPDYVAGGMSYGCAGVYSNVTKWDAKSYYPSTVLAFDIYDKDKDPNAHFLEMVRYFTHKRFDQKNMYKETNDKYYDDLQASSKVFINSAYGLLGTPGLNYNSFPNAQLITRCCRAGLQKCVLWATGRDIDYWWGVDDKLYKEIRVSEDVWREKYAEKYEGKSEIMSNGHGMVCAMVPKVIKKLAYKHSRTVTQDFKDFSFIDSKAELSTETMPRHDWELVNIDTDALAFAKKDGSEFTDEEFEMIHKEVNQIMYSEWEDDGIFDRAVIVKAKNYCLLPKGKDKLKFKGSSIIDAKKEPALREMLEKMIESLIYEGEDVVEIYNRYLKEAMDIKDISRWAVKKSITSKLYESDRANETKVVDAISGKDYSIGDKVFLFNVIDGMRQKVLKGEPQFFKKTGEPRMEENNILRVAEDFDGKYDKWHYIDRVYKTVEILQSVLDFSSFLRYNLVKNKEKIKDIL